MARLSIYESKAVSSIFGGLSLGDGRADPFFKITQDGPSYVTEGPGADGHVARCGTNNRLFHIEMTFKGTSSEHAKLTALHIADLEFDNGAGVAPLLVKDGNGSTLIQTSECWITGFPEQAHGITKPDVTWAFDAIIQPGGFILGGN